MPLQWQRWLKYAQAKLDSSLQQGEAELDRREADLEARSAGRPWLESTRDAPNFDEAKARIEHEARQAEAPRTARRPSDPLAAPPGPAARPRGDGSGLDAFDMAAHQKAADERLTAIRQELGLSDEGQGDRPTGDTSKGDAPKGDGPKGDEAKGATATGDAPKGDGRKGDTPTDEVRGDTSKGGTSRGVAPTDHVEGAASKGVTPKGGPPSR